MEVSIDLIIDRREYHTVHVNIDCHEENIRSEEDLHDYINEHVDVIDHTSSSTCYSDECTDYEQNDINWSAGEEDFANNEEEEDGDAFEPSTYRTRSTRLPINQDSFL
jgi:hypothetical protein